jgi:hypothetical protein
MNEMFGDDPMDILCERVNHTSVENKPGYNFMNDFNLIIDEIIHKIQEFIVLEQYNYDTDNNNSLEMPDIDAYELLVSSGHALCWAVEYIVNKNDFEWLKSEGKDYLLEKIGEYINLDNPGNYYKILPCYLKIVEIYSLQVV